MLFKTIFWGFLLSLALEQVNLLRKHLPCLYATKERLRELLLYHSDSPFAWPALTSWLAQPKPISDWTTTSTTRPTTRARSGSHKRRCEWESTPHMRKRKRSASFQQPTVVNDATALCPVKQALNCWTRAKAIFAFVAQKDKR